MIGIDIGNKVTKITLDNFKHLKFNSRLRIGNPGDVKLNKDFINVEYEGNSYTIGPENGNTNMQVDKYFSEFHDVLLLTAIGISTKECNIEENIVIGTPVKDYAAIGAELKDRILNMGLKNIAITQNIDNKIVTKQKAIRVKNVQVFPQSAFIFNDMKKYGGKDVLVYDWGGGTVDISLWRNGKLEQADTLQQGCHVMYQNAADTINSDYVKVLKTRLIPLDIERFILKNEMKIRNTIYDMKIVNNIIRANVIGLINAEENVFPVSTVDEIVLCGGGANVVQKYFKEKYNYADINLDEYCNSDVYYNIGMATMGD